jgi:zinc protease
MAFRASLHRIALLAVLACAALAANAQTAPPAGVTRGASVEGITEYRLANGLTVLLFPDASKPTTTVNVTYKVGSRHESYGETGMAHLLEHLVFKGTPSIPNVFQELGRRGMQFNGTTSFDRTNYYETFTANDDNLDWALRMEAERMTRSTFSKADLDTEMTVVRNEFEMGENNPRRVLWKRLQALAFDWHNYGNVTIGARSDVENVDIGRLRAFYETYYQPDNAVLIVAGKFDPEKTLGLVAKYLGSIPRPARALPRLYTTEPVQDGERSTVVRRVGSQQLVGVLYRAMSGAHPDAVAMEALGEIMTVAPAGRLYKALVDMKKATGVDAWTFTLADPGAIIFWAQVATEDPVEPARDAMLEVLGNVAKRPITAEEVERVRAKALKGFDEVFNDPEQAGVSLSEAIATGDWRLFFLYRDHWRNLKAEDVQRVATAWLKPANRTVGLFLPDASPDRAPEATPIDVAALVANYKGDAAAAAGETFDPTPANLDARTIRYTMANGTKVALLPKKTRGEVVRFSIRLHQGDERNLAGTPPTGSLAGAMLARGTQARDRQSFDDELDKLRAKAGFGGGSTSTSVGGETVRANLAATLKLAAEALRTPALAAPEFDKLKRERATALEASRTEPTAIAQRALARHDNPYPKGDVRYAATLDEDLAGIARVKLDEVAGFHRRFVGAGHGEVAIVGDFDPAEVRPLLDELLGGWKAEAPYARVPNPYRPTTRAEMRFETPDKPNAIIIGTINAQVRDVDPGYAALAVAERILGGGPEARIPTRLREKEGLSYSAGSYLQPGQIDDLGSIGMYAIFPPQVLAKVRTALDEEIARALDAGFTDDEVAAAKRALIEERRTNRAQDASLVSALASQAYLGRTFAESAKLDAAIEAVDVAAANAALRKFLARDRIAWAFAGDFAKK